MKPNPDRPYVAKFPDEHGNLCCHVIPRGEAFSIYFENVNVIDLLNHKRQHELALKKKWIVKSADYAAWFRIVSTIVGMSLVDTMEGVSFMVDSNHPLKNVRTKTFTGTVINAILWMKLSDSTQPTRAYIPPVSRPVSEIMIPDNPSPVSQLTDPSGSTELVSGNVIAVPPGAPGIPSY